MAASILLFTSCQNDSPPSSLGLNGSHADKDTLLIQWLDTVQLLDKQSILMSLSDILEKTKASVVYLDFWNSHCVPCMKAFPDLNELTRHYPERDLKIVYLNTDENPERWQKALAFTKNENHPDHYRVKHPEFETLSKVGLNVYPRYLVMSRNKMILEFRAPVPYRAYIDSLLDIVNEN